MAAAGTTGEGPGLKTGTSRAFRGMFFFSFNVLFFNFTNDFLIRYNPDPTRPSTAETATTSPWHVEIRRTRQRHGHGQQGTIRLDMSIDRQLTAETATTSPWRVETRQTRQRHGQQKGSRGQTASTCPSTTNRPLKRPPPQLDASRHDGHGRGMGSRRAEGRQGMRAWDVCLEPLVVCVFFFRCSFFLLY